MPWMVVMTIYDDEKTHIVPIESLVKKVKKFGHDALVQIYPQGPELGKKWELNSDEMVIGRDAVNEVVVAKNAVSRKHAKLTFDGVNRILTDLNSTNGTYLNNRPIQSSLLNQGDQIKIGDAIFKYLVGSNVETAYHEEIYRMTIIDGLTNIYNKRFFMEEINRETARATRHERPLSLIIFDIDHFKKINDSYGHLAGDTVLQHLTRVVSERIRTGEVFARYGGEEFAILLPETKAVGAAILAEQVRALVAETHFVFEGAYIPLTISLGVASFDANDVSSTVFVAKADKKLYAAKASGRNCVVS